jgi:phage gp46-like protein
MTDITTIWNAAQSSGDWQVGNGDLVSGSDLDTAIYISLLTDRQARDDDDYDGTDRKGWWGDTDADYEIGSRIWLLRRQRLSTTVAAKAVAYAKEALQWLIDDGVIASVSITTQIVYPSRLNMAITYQKPDLTSTTVQYYWVWES